MNTENTPERNNENLKMITTFSITLYEIDEDHKRITIERDESFKGLAYIVQALIDNADKAFVRYAVATMATIVEAFKQYTQK
ncbi:hypothetical protein CGC53_01250 [Capnocytophaga leadbetteri]|uniref:Uncharacterized protein n=1 Tax=Capnocytophaga leadbetteri TaxID=327575 RepID=A0A250F9Z0_9FLAO|nr:hypothetical protein CGC53_01250 [Capnocytophaga leadbetteri]